MLAAQTGPQRSTYSTLVNAGFTRRDGAWALA